MRRSVATGDLAELDRALRRAGTPERATGEKAYLRSDLRFYGVSAAELRRIAREYERAHPRLGRRELRALVETAWQTGVHDHRSAAIALLERRQEELEIGDLPWLIRLVNASNTWAHVDWLAVSIIGGVVERFPAERRRLARWGRAGASPAEASLEVSWSGHLDDAN